jgi:hypothetical protein
MLDTFTPEQKASILAQVMREESQGASLRDCCKAQGITVQTFIDWRARARRHNQFDTLHMNGVHPERKPQKFKQEKPKTALQIALENAQRRTYPDDNPEDLHAVEHGEPPETPTAAPLPAVEPDIPAAPVEVASEPETSAQTEPVIEPVISSTNEETDVPKAKTEPMGKPRGVAAVMYQRMPWLNTLDAKTEKVLGPKPSNKQPGYTGWIKHRKSLMTPEQVEEIDGFFKANGSGKAKDTGVKPMKRRAPKPDQVAEQKAIAASRGGIEVEPVRANGRKRPVSAEVAQLAAQHAEVTGQLAQFEGASVSHVRREHVRESVEVERLKRALMALTLENLQLRGLL